MKRLLAIALTVVMLVGGGALVGRKALDEALPPNALPTATGIALPDASDDDGAMDEEGPLAPKGVGFSPLDEAASFEEYYYACLDDAGKKVYNLVSRAIEQHEASVKLPVLDADDGFFVISCVYNDHPEYYHVDYNGMLCTGAPGEGYVYHLTYSRSAEAYAEEMARIDSWVEGFRASLPWGASDYDITKKLNATLASHVAYNHRYSEQSSSLDFDAADSDTTATLYAGIINGRAVCEGYARSALYILRACGIPAAYASSDASDHAWNIAQIDGHDYLLDTTWGDPVDSERLDAEGFALNAMPSMAYLNVTTDESIDGHEDPDSLVPRCTARDASYFEREGLAFGSVPRGDKAASLIMEAIGKGAFTVDEEKGQVRITLKFASEQEASSAEKLLLDQDYAVEQALNAQGTSIEGLGSVDYRSSEQALERCLVGIVFASDDLSWWQERQDPLLKPYVAAA